MNLIACSTFLAAFVITLASVEGFQQQRVTFTKRLPTSLYFFGDNNMNDEPADKDKNKQKKGFLGELKGMMNNFDAVVDDFVYKRMGNGEQFYGKRKYNPSGNIEGDYNGMGQSDLLRIEIARVKKEELELRRQRRLEAEREAKGKGPII